MKRLMGLALSAGIMTGAIGCTSAEAPKMLSEHGQRYTPQQMDEMRAHMQADFDSKDGKKIETGDPVRIPWQGDLYTMPINGLQEGQTVPFGQVVEVDLAGAHKKDDQCVNLHLPDEAYALDIKVAQNHPNMPITAQVGGTALKLCNDSDPQKVATAVVEVTERGPQ